MIDSIKKKKEFQEHNSWDNTLLHKDKDLSTSAFFK